MVALAEVAEISGGITKNAKRSALPIQRPYLSVANVHFNRIDTNYLSNIGVNEAEIGRAQLMPGDLMVVEGNGSLSQLGRVAIWHGQVSGCLHQNHLIKVRPKPTVKSKWLLYWLMSSAGREAIEATASSTSGLHTLSLAKVGSLPAPIASLEEQEAAIAYIDLHLSRLDEAVTTLQGIQAKLKQARASILKAAVEGKLRMHENAIPGSPEASNHIDKWQQEINEIKDKNRTSNRSLGKKQNKDLQSCADEKGWIQVTVSEIANVQLGRQRSPKDHNGPWMTPYLRAANITWDGFALADVNSMNFAPSEVERFALKVGDILLNEASGSASEVGKPAIWRGEIPDCCFQNTLLRVRTIPSLQRWILLHFLADAKSGRFSRSSKGVGIHHLSANTLSAHVIRVPPPEQQERIVAEVDRRFSVLDQVEATVKTSLARCSKLRQAILKRAFIGR
jgi:type I restriction enzyme S subunit